jgi:hypothetical protein
MDLKQRITADLADARRRTEELLAPLDEDRMTTQYDQLMSPPVWDYAHIGVFEELWLVQTLSGAAPIDEELQSTYNAIETPRVVRGRRKLLGVSETKDYLGRVRERTLALLEEHDLPFVMVDEPQGFESSVPPLVAAPSPRLAVVRFHGRRAATWEKPNVSVTEKFRYLYGRDELAEWVPKVLEAAAHAKETHVVFNNCYGNYGTTNALEMTELLREAAASPRS